MMPTQVELGTSRGAFFVLKNVEYAPLASKVGEALEITGEITLFGFKYIGPVWVIAYVTYPKEWWQEIIKTIGAREVRASALVVGGKFDLFFDEGFEKEGTYTLVVSLYGGPTLAVAPSGISTFTLPPIPAIANYKTTFTVAGKAGPEPSPAPGGTGVSLGSLRISPANFFEGDEVTITCPITSLFQTKQEGTLVYEIHETSLIRTGDLINTVVSDKFTIDTGQSLDVSVKWKGAGAVGGKDLWVYFKQPTTKYSAQYYGSPMTLKSRSDAGKFTLGEPRVDKREVVAGDKVVIVCPVSNQTATDQQVQITLDIYAPVNQLDIGNGSKIYTKTVPAAVKANTTYDAQFDYLTIASNDDRRYVGVKVAWGAANWVDNVFKGIPQPVFTVTKAGQPTPIEQEVVVRSYAPQVSPKSAPIGTTISIQCPVKLESGVATQIKVKCEVHESDWRPYIATGDWLWENYQIISLSPGQTVPATFQYPLNGTVGNKDIRVEVFSLRDIKLKDSNWQNTFEDMIQATSGPTPPLPTPTPTPTPTKYKLNVYGNITGAGEVLIDPYKTEYDAGEMVMLTAIPAYGYYFDHWSGDISETARSIQIQIGTSNVSIIANYALIEPKVTFTVGVTDIRSYMVTDWRVEHFDESGTMDYASEFTGIKYTQLLAQVSLKGNIGIVLRQIDGAWWPTWYSPKFTAKNGGQYYYNDSTQTLSGI